MNIAGRDSGFTLLELVVVLVILAMIVAVVIPRIPTPGDDDLPRTARRLAATIRYLNDTAIASGTRYRLRLAFAENGYSITRVAPDGTEASPTDTLLGPVTFPDKVSLHEAATEQTGRTMEGSITLPFGPTGLGVFATIHLKGAKEREMTVFAYPATGKVTVEEGYQEQPQ